MVLVFAGVALLLIITVGWSACYVAGQADAEAEKFFRHDSTITGSKTNK